MDFSKYAIKLDKGAHNSPKEGMCVMECVAYIAGEEHTDMPRCADPDLAALAIYLNDHPPTAAERQKLLRMVLRLAGSAGRVSEDVRLAAGAKRVLLHNLEMERAPLGPAPRVFREAWLNGLALLDELLPPLDMEGIAPDVVEQKAEELVLITQQHKLPETA